MIPTPPIHSLLPSSPGRRSRPVAVLLLAATLVLAVLGSSTTPVAAQAGDPQTFSLKPATAEGPDTRPHLVYETVPGQSFSDVVAVTNHSTTPLTLRLYASDAITPEDGGFDLLPSDQESTDVATWVTLESTSLVVPAQSTTLVPLTVTVPADATPGDHVGGVVAALVTTATGAEGQQVTVENRVGTRIYLRVDGPLQPTLEVSGLTTSYRGSLNPFSGGTVDATFTVTNTGNVRLSGQQLVTVTGPGGVELGRAVLPDLPELLPGGSVRQSVEVTGIWPTGRVWTDVEVRPVDPLGEDLLEPVRETGVDWAVPWLLLVAMVLALIGGVLLGRRSRRRAAPRGAAGAAGQGPDPDAVPSAATPSLATAVPEPQTSGSSA